MKRLVTIDAEDLALVIRFIERAKKGPDLATQVVGYAAELTDAVSSVLKMHLEHSGFQASSSEWTDIAERLKKANSHMSKCFKHFARSHASTHDFADTLLDALRPLLRGANSSKPGQGGHTP